ncbi:hypothetical protein LAUMK42_02956 [Mycobacterium persicum]|uniref:Uncharacterized protein n=1 Tax=Mycobacterium persicum TaxID=1487726 RepID=A0AB38UTT4_9MYCO|nr:hypothetical protein LAUMK42_02956 [Mycobacterium persicum]
MALDTGSGAAIIAAANPSGTTRNATTTNPFRDHWPDPKLGEYPIERSHTDVLFTVQTYWILLHKSIIRSRLGWVRVRAGLVVVLASIVPAAHGQAGCG